MINRPISQNNLDYFESFPPTIQSCRPPQCGNAVEECDRLAQRRRHSHRGEEQPFILVADDEPLIRSTIVEILREEGYDVVGAKDGVEAVACTRRIAPDIFLADVAMPKLNGVEAAKQIKALSPSTRIICFSGHAATSELLEKARKEGYDFECLAKPIKPEALIRAIQSEPM
jgi:CheY-like chemotaxis protein